MTKDACQRSPSETALSYLKGRIEADESLDQGIRQAVLADLASARPSAFRELRALLAVKSRTDGVPDEVESTKPPRSAP